VFNFPLSNKYVFLISFHTSRKLFFSAFFSKNLNRTAFYSGMSFISKAKKKHSRQVNLYIKFPNLYNLDHPNLFIWMMLNDDPVFLSAFIEYLDNNYLSRKVMWVEAKICSIERSIMVSFLLVSFGVYPPFPVH
jgi:hypothetical protein